MCGITGYAGLAKPELLRPMTDSMIHRGPDDSGTWWDNEQGIGLGHRRLSIIDLSKNGKQPMASVDQSTWITYNGEIYNFQEQRRKLEKEGYVFRSKTDTEVLLALYEKLGIDFVKELNGIFAFAIWDSKVRRLILVRDHVGAKPLYYRLDGKKLYFASEIKALLRVPGTPRSIHTPSIEQYLTFLWVPGENTMLSGIKKVEPGHLAIRQDGKFSTKRWFNLNYEPDESKSESHWVEEVRDTFMRCTSRQMVSDVPLGAFLSGGLDSTSIVASMRKAFPDRPINAYTIQYEDGAMEREQGVDDYPYAVKAAQELQVDLKTLRLKPDVVSLLPKLIYHLDEPDADPAVMPSYLISKHAREDGTTVLLSGTGGDELFFGYRSHQAYRLFEKLNWVSKPPFSNILSAGSGIAATLFGGQHHIARRTEKFHRGLTHRGLKRHMEIIDWSNHGTRQKLFGDKLTYVGDIPEAMRKYASSFEGSGEINLHSHLLTQSFLASHNFLYTDKSSMAVGVEARVPFMDTELMRLTARIPERLKLKGNVTKHILKTAMEPYISHDLIYRKKAGFGAPLRDWIREDLKEHIDQWLSPRVISERGLFDPNAVNSLRSENSSGQKDHAYLLYALINLEIWTQTFIDAPGTEVTL